MFGNLNHRNNSRNTKHSYTLHLGKASPSSLGFEAFPTLRFRNFGTLARADADTYTITHAARNVLLSSSAYGQQTTYIYLQLEARSNLNVLTNAGTKKPPIPLPEEPLAPRDSTRRSQK